jgi:RNA polymerase sigma factor (sigma-70 family)
MSDPASAETSLSLLKRLKLRPTDEIAWNEFVERYGARILRWCRYWGLQHADAADITQTVLTKIARNIGRYDKDLGSFRGWLKTITHHAWYDLINSPPHKVATGGEAVYERLKSEEARDDLTRQIESAWEQELMELATDRVQLRVKPKTWKIFELTAFENVSGEHVADDLGMSVPAVYRAKSRVLKMLRDEVASLQVSEFA